MPGMHLRAFETTCFEHDIPDGYFKGLPRVTASDKVFYNQFNIAKKYVEY